MQSIVVDTSSIIFGLSNKKDAFRTVREATPGYLPIISQGIVNELGALKERHEKYSKFAGAALIMLKISNVRVINDSSPVDDWIVKAAKENGYAACTNDIMLKKRLKAEGIKAFSITRSGTLR